MPFNHLHTLNRFLADSEIKGEAHRFQVKELWSQMVLYDADRGVIIVTDVVVDVLLGHLDEHDVGHAVSYLESAKLELRPVVRQFAEEPVSRLRQGLHVVRCHRVRSRMRLWLCRLLLLYVEVLHCGTRLICCGLAIHFN